MAKIVGSSPIGGKCSTPRTVDYKLTGRSRARVQRFYFASFLLMFGSSSAHILVLSTRVDTCDKACMYLHTTVVYRLPGVAMFITSLLDIPRTCRAASRLLTV